MHLPFEVVSEALVGLVNHVLEPGFAFVENDAPSEMQEERCVPCAEQKHHFIRLDESVGSCDHFCRLELLDAEVVESTGCG